MNNWDMKFGSKGELLCSCAVPILDTDNVCTNCGRKLDSDRLAQLIKLKNASNQLSEASECEKCNGTLVKGQIFCPNCGAKVTIREIQIPDKTFENCENCGASLVLNQKFCSDCGVEIQANHKSKTKVFGSSISKSNSTSNGKKVGIIAASILGFLILIIALGSVSQSGNQQDECFEREMTKFGAFADPKGWAVQSRLYCQSLYP